jgi:hypothetical protein
VTDDVIRWHLSGRGPDGQPFVAGVYPLLQDDTCFEDAIPAALARRLGSYVLTETMERRPDIGLDSYDRLFPNHDTMPHGGFGSLIAPPLQQGPRRRENSVFIDGNFSPWSDQWAFLARLQRLARRHIEGIVAAAERRGRILGVRLPPADEADDAPWTMPPSRRRREGPIVGELPRTLQHEVAATACAPRFQMKPAFCNGSSQQFDPVGAGV